jgi:radical SAM protein with 4Fe4S-binding SPASM domain
MDSTHVAMVSKGAKAEIAPQGPASEALAAGLRTARPKRFNIIYVELTNACNFTCDYCPIDEQTRKKTIMSREFAIDVLDQIADNDLTDVITFHLMGEPYLHRNLSELTAYAESRGLRVRLLTNGSLLDPKRNRALFDANLSHLEVGFRTPNDSSFSMRLRGGSLTLVEYIRRVEELLDDKIRLGARTDIAVKFFIRTKAAEYGLGESYEHLTSERDNLAMARHLYSFVMRSASRHGKAIEGWDAIPIRVVDGEYPIYPGITLNWSRLQDFWMREQRRQKGGWDAVICGCNAAFRENFAVLADGRVTTCCVDYDAKNVVGDLRKNSLMEVINSPEAQRMERSFKWFRPPTKFCRECKGGPTFATSVVKQAVTVYLDGKARILGRGLKRL